MQIRKISLSRLLKTEMPLIMDNIIRVLKEFDVEKLHLDFNLKVLEKNREQLNAIQGLYGPLKLTPKVREWHEQRVRLAGSISLQMRGIAQVNLLKLGEELEITQKIVKRYFNDVKNKNKEEVEASVNSFLNAVDDNPQVKEVLLKVDLLPYVEELRNATHTHNRLYIQRNAERPERQRGIENKEIMKEAQKAMRTLFEQIDLANRTYPELEYEHLIIKINGVLVRFTNTIKTRDTYNKKRAEKK